MFNNAWISSKHVLKSAHWLSTDWIGTGKLGRISPVAENLLFTLQLLRKSLDKFKYLIAYISSVWCYILYKLSRLYQIVCEIRAGGNVGKYETCLLI